MKSMHIAIILNIRQMNIKKGATITQRQNKQANSVHLIEKKSNHEFSLLREVSLGMDSRMYNPADSERG